MEFLFGILALGIVMLLFVLFFGLVRYLIQNYLLYRIGQHMNLDNPVVSFIPFGSFYVAGQTWDSELLEKGKYKATNIGLIMALIGVVVWLMGLSVGDIAISYLLLESVVFFGLFSVYFKGNKLIAGLISLANVLLFGIPSVVVFYLMYRDLEREKELPINL